MTREEFNNQADRLREKFGKTWIDPDWTKMAWAECQSLPVAWFERMANFFIGEQYKPKMSDVRGFVAKLREKDYQARRAQESKDSEDFWRSSYHPEDVKLLMKTIKDRVLGKVSDKEWEDFRKGLGEIARSGRDRVRCNFCEDFGLVISSSLPPTVWKCFCTAGHRRDEPYRTFTPGVDQKIKSVKPNLNA